MPRGPRRPIAPILFEIYCRVVDNLGDAGVCWRLARQLATEHRANVTLRIDAPEVLRAIVPAAAVGATVEGVAIRDWTGAVPPARPRTVLVSAFGCELPGPVRAALPSVAGVVWVDLEYLSAEPWVDGCHGLASPKPGDGAVEHFFYPGFTATSGGLPRERGLLDARDAFRASADAAGWLRARGIDAREDERRVSLFCYPGAPLPDLLDALAGDPRPTHLLVAAGTSAAALGDALGARLEPGRCVARGALRVECFALLPQPDYDRLLWSCAVNFVRGEDSWIRALWAGAPFVWQPYRQSGDTHSIKLDAFLARLREAAAPAALAAVEPAAAVMRAWNTGHAFAPAWSAYRAALPAVGALHARWAALLARDSDLATRLVEFCESRL